MGKNDGNLLLFKCVLEACCALEQIKQAPTSLAVELIDSTLQAIDYNVNKYILNGNNGCQKAKALEFANSLKSIIKGAEEEPDGKSPEFHLSENRWTLAKVKLSKKPQSIIEPSEKVLISQAANILDCSNVIIRIPSKCKSVLMEKCINCDAVVHSIVSSIEIINCRDCQVQIEEIAPTVTIESCDNVTVFFPETCITEEFKIFTSKTSQVNLKVLDKEGNLVTELPIPEQFQTKIPPQKPYTTKTEPLSHAGSS